MNITYVPIDGDQHGHLEILFHQTDIDPKYKAELKKLSKTAHIKGFRQGAVPATVLEKMYGTTLKADVLNKLVDEYVNNYQKEKDIQFLGDLLPASEQLTDQDINDSEIKFVFEVGILPKLNIQEAIDSTKLTKYTIPVTDSLIEEEWKNVLDRSKESVEVEEPIILNDLVDLSIREMKDGKILENGHESNFIVLNDDLLTEEFQQTILNKSKGDQFEIDIRQIEKNTTEEAIRQYFLKLDASDHKEVGHEFMAEIIKVSRKKELEVDEQFFEKVFGSDSEIKDIDKAKSYIGDQIKNYLNKESEKLLDIEISAELIKALKASYPEKFLIKWLQRTYKEWAEQSGHELEHSIYHFKEHLSWKAISDYIVEKEQLGIDPGEFIQLIINDMKQQYGGVSLPDETWKSFALRTLENKERANHYTEIYIRTKVLDVLKTKVQIEQSELSMEDFKTRVKQLTSHDHHH